MPDTLQKLDAFSDWLLSLESVSVGEMDDLYTDYEAVCAEPLPSELEPVGLPEGYAAGIVDEVWERNGLKR